MDLEESGGVESVRETCESCGAKLTKAELEGALEGTTDRFLCTRCANEELAVGAEEPEED